ncbi:hypothetical protein HPB51_014899 [Rhipicephalus microplus]|uniref:Uncharacterized protein n=1 Tax=Rhipicephalus microplus TaxID=6941 RepID=A0A9J6EU21_RHIMP|nr:hypothetical protein HPB51_014899 [Rhipicephalus microplus]
MKRHFVVVSFSHLLCYNARRFTALESHARFLICLSLCAQLCKEHQNYCTELVRCSKRKQCDGTPCVFELRLLLVTFDDSSSISSGLSDTFAELSTNDNLTDSSLSSDPYGCLKRRPHHPGMAPSGTSSGACNKGMPDRSSRKSSDHHSSASGSAVVGGGGMLPTSIRSRNANVKKTDSSMQTDSSALVQQGAVPPHLQSSANWKKYIQQQDLQHQQSKTNSTESLKSKENKRSGGQSSSKSGSKSTADSNRHEAVHSKTGGKSRTGCSSSGSGETKLRSYSADTAMIGSDLALDKMRASSAGMGAPVRSSGIEYASTAVVVTNRKLPGRPPNVSGSGPPSACMMAPGKRPSSTASSGSGRSGGSFPGKEGWIGGNGSTVPYVEPDEDG